jgi:ABC-2 type transport system permease protein
MNCLEYPIFILCGFVFPIDILPSFIKLLSYALSPTWAVKILMESSLGINDFSMFYKKIFILLFISIVYFIISKILFSKIDRRTRIEATLGGS